MMRTHTCGELNLKNEGQKVSLCGWVDSKRNHGGVLFIVLRDLYGITQIVVEPSNKHFNSAENLGNEYVIKAEGTVRKRPEGNANKNIPTGEIEVYLENLEILNTSKEPAFAIAEYINVNEETRLKYRYLDIRRETMKKNLVFRSKIAQVVRNYLYSNNFNEVETPILTKSTPEGARDFLVPSRINPGKFYALPQSPQMFKQILMVSGMDRYFQLARNFRDEDLRSDRQLEHTQIDLEMSFVNERDVALIVEGMMKEVFKFAGYDIETPFMDMEYEEAMLKYGTDKPDLRYDYEIKEVTEIFKNTEFKIFRQTVESNGTIRGINAKNAHQYSRSEIDKLTETLKSNGAKGLVWLKMKDGKIDSSISKFLKEMEVESLKKSFDIKEGDTVFILSDDKKNILNYIGILRNEIIKRDQNPKKKWAFLWVRHFPLLEWKADENRYDATHNPFTAPLPEELYKLDKKEELENIKSCQYDLVLNGVELGSGSVRNHRREIQEKIFKLMGYSEKEIYEKFGMLVEALGYGAPPHGGIGIGFDRLIAVICGYDSIREVIAFPKTTSGICPMTEAPPPPPQKQLNELKIQIKK
ncbi:MAG: aspartate--tRNA ligase [Elusimicrobiales bacterium]|nr:aspartate--tRNA ligase [Elusimicrobiales bacterium]